MRVGEVAERAGVNVETLRYYERRGLLPAPERTPSGHRRYDEETVRFLGAIKEAQAVGFTLAEIAEYLRAARRSGGPSEALRVRMAAKIDQIDAPDRGTAAHAGRARTRRRLRLRLARSLHLRRRVPRPPRRGAGGAASLLHITNGESAGNTLRQTALGGAVLPWQDVLHEGPVPALPRQKLLRDACPLPRRLRLGSAGKRCSHRSSGATGNCSRRSATTSRSCSGSSTTSTTSSSSSTCSRSPTPRQAAPELIVIGSFPGKPSFAGLGELTASELETLWPSRRRAAPAALAGGHERVGRRAGPGADEHWPSGRRVRARHLPFLAPALRRLLEELPAPADGLSGTERRALQAVAAGARTPPAAFVAAQRLEEAPFMRRHLVLPSPLRARAGNGEAPRDRGRHSDFPRRLRSATASPSHDSSCG